MSAIYTWDVLSTLDGFGSFSADGDWGGYWGKQGPEFLARRQAQYEEEQRLVLGATTYREFVHYLGAVSEGPKTDDAINARMRSMPTTVVSNSLADPLDWPDAVLERGDAVDVVAGLKRSSPVPLRSHGSLSLNRALLAAGLVDRIQLTVFPVLSGRTGSDPVFAGAEDFDLELVDERTFDGGTKELLYRPTRH
ncbi:dihydrofolate reductase family protein [Microbacterium sp. HJ5]